MKSKIYILLAIGIMVLSAADLNAQVKAGSFTVSPVVGYSVFPYKQYFDDTATYGLSVGYNFSERFAIEATYNILDTKIVSQGITHTEGGGGGFPPPPGQGPPPQDQGEVIIDTPGGADVDAYQYAFEMLFYIYPGKKFAPYAAIGIGVTQFEYPYDYEDTDDDIRSYSSTNGPMGFGFKYFVTDTIAVRADFRGMYPYHDNNLRATVGVTFQLGGK